LRYLSILGCGAKRTVLLITSGDTDAESWKQSFFAVGSKSYFPPHLRHFYCR